MQSEQSCFGEEVIRPSYMIDQGAAEGGPFILLAQERPKPSSDEPVERRELAGEDMLEVAE
ncbi:MAG TPA: hypothetical protein VK630_20700, partial [Reyranella sp.]|nr:hypothetical protein [Reyranella sp.]